MCKSKWRTISYDTEEGYKGGIVTRKLWVDNEEKPKYKFKEKIDFGNNNQKNNYVICIGLNPAKAEMNLDETNKRLVRLLKNEYCGYYLCNIYPEITDNATQINLDDNENINFASRLKDILEKKTY